MGVLQEPRAAGGAGGKRPFKLWDGARGVRKGLVAATIDELVQRGREKLGFAQVESLRLVLECDGTQVEDSEYFRTLPANTVLLLLRQGERWLPAGVDVIRAVSAIPRIVCETINALELQDETPSWKIMDNKGRVTVVLHWDQRGGGAGGVAGAGAARASPAAPPDAPSPAPPHKFSPSRRPSVVAAQVTTKTADGAIYASSRYVAAGGPQITVINHDEPKGAAAAMRPHVHTPECAHVRRAGSPATVVASAANGIECDFHCCALHEEGRRIAVHKHSVATSPIQEAGTGSPQPAGAVGRHVRFLDVEGTGGGGGRGPHDPADSSESETENTVMEDEAVTSEKFLLLIDQLSVDQKRHLSIKDIGIILERLNSKILDVERLDRDSESDDCYNWTIKATIRGADMRELGVIYNGNYYAISEHPGYREENEGVVEEADEEEEEEEEEDRL